MPWCVHSTLALGNLPELSRCRGYTVDPPLIAVLFCDHVLKLQVVLTESLVTKIIDVKPAAMGITAEVCPVNLQTAIIQHPTGQSVSQTLMF